MKRLWLISLLICCTWRVIYGQSVQYTSSEDISRETALSSDKKENILQTAGTPSEIVNPTPNWDVYEVLNDEVNVTQSIEYVKNIPVYHYWDVHRGGFRTGILGDKIIDKYPQFVTYSFIKNSTADPRDPISLINVTTIDTSSLFMHLLLVTQYMDQKSKNISQTIRVLEDQFATFDTKLNMWKNVTGDEWKTAAQLRAECTQKEIQIEMLGKRIEMVELRKQARLATLREYYQNKTRLLEEFHEFSLRAREAMYERLAVAADKVGQEKLELLISAEEDRLNSQLQHLNLTYQQTIEKLRQDINFSIATLYLRAEEESRAAHENEDVSRNILVAQAENMRRNFEEVFLLFKSQVANMIDIALSSPLLVLKWALLFSFLLSLSVLSTEMYSIIKLLILRSMTSPLVIRESKRGRPHLSSARVHDSLPAPEEISENSKNISLDQLVLSSDARERLYRLSQMFVMRETVLRGFASAVNIHNRSHSSLSLPNILIIGPPGTGKSVAATTLAHSSGLPYLSLCGGDILGASPTLSSPTAAPASVHSGGPGGLLRDVLDSAAVANNQKGYLVILDEADALIATAKKPNCPLAENENREVPESNEEVIADCLHILLHRLRINSPSLGTIITTNMEIHMIDAAFLDRMDYIIHLDLPNAFYRLKAFIYYTALYLSSYLSPTQKENLNLLHKSTLPSQQNSTRTVSADQNATEILGILEEIFEKKISLTGLNVPVAATGKKVASSSGTKKKSKKNTKSDNPPVDITPQSEGTSIDSSSNVDNNDVATKEESSQGDVLLDEVDVVWCVGMSLLQSDGWSYREIEKFIKGIIAAILSTERCQLTSQLWHDQIRYKKAHIHLGRQSMPTSSTPPQGSPST